MCENDDPRVSRLAATDEADEAVWHDVLRRFPERKEAVIFNKNVPSTILDRLSSDEDPRIRRFVAGKRKLSDELFKRLADDPEPEVRSSVATNPKVPMEILEALCDDREGWGSDRARESRVTRTQS